MRLLAAIQRSTPAAAGEAEAVGAAYACEVLLRYLSARQLRFLQRAVAPPRPGDDPGGVFDVFTNIETIGAEIAPLFGLARRSAQQKLEQAQSLAGELPKILAMVEAGDLDLQRARSIHEVMAESLHPDDGTWAVVEEALLEKVAGRTNARVRELTRRVVADADPEAFAVRHEDALAQRRIDVYPLPEAMGGLTGVLAAPDAQMVSGVLDALADGCRYHLAATGTRDERTHEQRRADAFVALFRSVATGTAIPVLPEDRLHFGGRYEAAPDGTDGPPGAVAWWRPPSLPDQQGRRPAAVSVTVPWSTLTGLDECAADLAGHGPIPASLARALAAEAGRFTVVPVPDELPRTPRLPERDEHYERAERHEHDEREQRHERAERSVRSGCAPSAPIAATILATASIAGARTSSGFEFPAPSLPAAVGSVSAPAVRTTSVHGVGDVGECPNRGRRYRPKQSVVDAVVAFHQTCRHPGCRRRAQRCDIDHVVNYPDGPTCVCNLIPLCRFHHRLKTHGGWEVRFAEPSKENPPGTVTWTSPYGRRYHDVPTMYAKSRVRE